MTRRLPKAFSEDTMRIVWANSRDRSPGTAGSPGIDGVTAPEFSSDLKFQIARTRLQLQRQTYQFSKLRVFPIPKKSGGERIIAVPTVRDRFLQRVVLRHLENDPRFNAASHIAYGFSKGRTLAAAQSAALSLRTKYPWVLQADIVSFFDRIDRRILRRKVTNAVRSKIVREILLQIINCELDESDPKAASLAVENQIKRGTGLRQGMPASPMLSNLLLKEFDQALSQAGFHAIRYADDIAIFGKTQSECLDALTFVKSELHKLKLEIPELSEATKTNIAGPTEDVEFLGVAIRQFSDGYRFCIPKDKIRKIDESLSKISSFEYCLRHRRTIPDMMSTIDAMIAGHARSMAHVADLDSFVGRLTALKAEHVKRLLEGVLGARVVAELTHERRAVLGVEPF
ncbi:MAG: reverse transcriptase domain-containing protein [Caulobacter sp.]|nr:reverse transcriptase domain-containing protein [Caulobacter sp.]